MYSKHIHVHLCRVNVTLLTLSSLVVSICTGRLEARNFTFCPHSVFRCICVVALSQCTAVICLYDIHRLVFLTNVTEFSARYEFSLYIIYNNISLQRVRKIPYPLFSLTLSPKSSILYVIFFAFVPCILILSKFYLFTN